jgi:hypothetical protein
MIMILPAKNNILAAHNEKTQGSGDHKARNQYSPAELWSG